MGVATGLRARLLRMAQRDDRDDQDDDAQDGDEDSGQTLPPAPSGDLASYAALARAQTSMPRRRAER